MPLRAAIEKMYGTGGMLAGDLESCHLIADFERQVELGGGRAPVRPDCERGLAERLAAAGERLDHA